MKKRLTQEIEIPEGVSCEYAEGILKCRKESIELNKELFHPGLELQINEGKLVLVCERGNKKDFKVMMSFIAHIKNMFAGLEEKYVYKLEAVNVHFPMAVKLQGEIVNISNFLGEKVDRKAKVLKGVDVEIKGNKITVSSNDKESAGQTASNLERATKVKKRDRRIFQDGIFITESPGRRM